MLDDIKYYFKISLPTLTLILFIFLNLFISNKIDYSGQLFVFQAIFFWLVYSPKSIPLYIIFFIGLIQDVIFLLPIGTSSLVFVFLIFLFEKYNKFFLEPSFFELQISFTIFLIIGTFSFWGINSMVNFNFLPFRMDYLYEVIFNVIIFPLNYYFLYLLFKKLNLDKIYKKNV
tara:strand:+ start:230 stop:748 length:519 start_codon:yes stop_codon:yes gene_type:complete